MSLNRSLSREGEGSVPMPTGRRVRPVRVELRHDTACPMLARHLGLPVAVYQPHTGLVLDAASLAVPVVNC
jgi:hypothetical protein